MSWPLRSVPPSPNWLSLDRVAVERDRPAGSSSGGSRRSRRRRRGSCRRCGCSRRGFRGRRAAGARCRSARATAAPVLRTLNGGLPSWKLKLFQKMSLSVMTLSSGGGNFSRVQRVRDDPERVVVEAALGDRHVAHVRRAEADRAAPAVDVPDHRLDRLVLRRRLPDVEGAVVDVVRLGVEHPAADGVERVEAVDAGLRRDQVVHRVAVEVRDEEAVGACSRAP